MGIVRLHEECNEAKAELVKANMRIEALEKQLKKAKAENTREADSGERMNPVKYALYKDERLFVQNVSVRQASKITGATEETIRVANRNNRRFKEIYRMKPTVSELKTTKKMPDYLWDLWDTTMINIRMNYGLDISRFANVRR